MLERYYLELLDGKKNMAYASAGFVIRCTAIPIP